MDVVMKQQLSELVERYNNTVRHHDKEHISEETIRVWVNELLGIFGWNVQDINQVQQEQVLRGREQERLQQIHSSHRRPDYTLKNGSITKAFVDTKALTVDIFTSAETAFQIRSYGWSAQVPCSFVTNFEQFVIYDTRFMPQPEQNAILGTKQFVIDEYVERFDELFEVLCRERVCNNALAELYRAHNVEGTRTLDDSFSAFLSEARLNIARSLVANNPNIANDERSINYYTQIILDRIVFIRVCESKGIEENEKLRHLTESNEGFWNAFKNCCYVEFYNHYDGAMFSHDMQFQQLQLDNEVLIDFINGMYYPCPYCFEVIPVKVIATIYEQFLGVRLAVNDMAVQTVQKEEYVDTQGVVCTPEHIVDMVCKQTIDLEHIQSIPELLNLKILDPCCGSGVFLVACYDMLANRALELIAANPEDNADYGVNVNGSFHLTIKARREIVINCLHAIDCDDAATEVAKMSLALKIVDGVNQFAWEQIGVFGDKILHDIDKNIKVGNTLVDTNCALTANEILEIKPLSIENEFNEVFNQNGGFSYVIGNPPYVETKRYKAAQPVMHRYLRNSYATFEGKADLAVIFIEKCLRLLSEHGKLGFIIQRRWFKTVYGGKARQLINNGRHLDRLIDFSATDIFPGRITYVSIVVLGKCATDNVRYTNITMSAEEIKTRFENAFIPSFEDLQHNEGNHPWSFESAAIEIIKQRLTAKWGTLQAYPGIQIKDGIQALYKKLYHLKDITIHGDIATGYNGNNETVTIETAVLRGVVYNRVFYPFKHIIPNAYCIFPYRGASNTPITMDELKEEYPLAYSYLSAHKEELQSNVECRDGNIWHTFTREHNHPLYEVDKIIIPMTAQDTIASFSHGQGLYMDNSNVWFITIRNANPALMKAITCIINSTAFSVLAKAGANPQAGGYFKFNKQYLTPVPFPSDSCTEQNHIVQLLAEMHDDIADLEERACRALPVDREILNRMIREKWKALDDAVYELYEVTEEEKKQLNAVGRTIDRVELLYGVR